jgi:hypothetical protein
MRQFQMAKMVLGSLQIPEIFDNSLEFHFQEYECQFEQTFRIPMDAVCAYSVSNIDQYSTDDYQKLLNHHIVNVAQ